MIYDVAILGAGASGLFLAANLQHKNVLLLEHNLTVGAKIAVSGGGRANVTNEVMDESRYFAGDPTFVKKVLDRFDNRALLEWLVKRGCRPVVAKPRQYFCPKSAKELIAALKRESRAKLVVGAKIKYVRPGFQIGTSKGVFAANNVVVATGGLSFKKLGASGVGYEIAKSFGHGITPLRPALVGFTVQPQQFWFKELSGISLKAHVKVGQKHFFDHILFAHRGISGPAILNASLYWEKGEIEIAFIKNVWRFLQNPKKILSTQLPLPKRFVKTFLAHIGVRDIQLGRLSEDERKRLGAFESYKFAPAGTFGFERAEVTKGGVVLDEIDPLSMQSKLHKGLYFIGEVLDVTGELGGYNFQWAFSSAWVAKEALTH